MTNQFHTYIRYKKSKVGVMVARVVDEKNYSINVSLVHPKLDTFDKEIAIPLAVGKLINFTPLPLVCVNKPNTKRAEIIKSQIDRFCERAAKVFKDKKYKKY